MPRQNWMCKKLTRGSTCKRKRERSWGGRESWDAGLTPSEGEDRKLGRSVLVNGAVLRKVQQGHQRVPEPMSPSKEAPSLQEQPALASLTLSVIGRGALGEHSISHHRDNLLTQKLGPWVKYAAWADDSSMWPLSK